MREDWRYRLLSLAASHAVDDGFLLTVKKLSPHWDREIPHQKWTQFYNRILSKFAVRKGLKLMVAVDILDASEEEIEEMRAALRELEEKLWPERFCLRESGF